MLDRLRQMDKRLLTILLIVFVQLLGASMVNPILPLFAQSQFDMEPQTITLLLTAFFAAQFIAGPYIGRLSDRRGRLPVLIISQVGTVIAFLMIGVAQSAAVLFIARVLDGITGGNIIVAQAYVTDITPEAKRTQALGYIFAAFGLGFVVGPALGGALAAAFGPQIPFLFAALAAFITVCLTYFTLEETVTAEDQAHSKDNKTNGLQAAELIRNIPLVAVLVVTFVAQFGLGLLISTFALFYDAVIFADLDDASVSLAVGAILALFGIVQVLTQLAVLPRVIARFSDTVIVLFGALLRGTSMFILAVALGPLLAALSTIIFSVGNSLMMPPLQSLTTKMVPPDQRGAILGIYQSVINLAVIFSTAIAGSLFALNPASPYWLSGTLFWLSLLPGLFLWRWSRRRRQQAEAVAAQPS